MTNQRNTKRALIMSALSLLLCISMLIGSTYAWFTDNVTSTGNTIQSGTLNVDLVDADGVTMEGKVIKFDAADKRDQDKILWEPGCTYETEPVYVVNKGSLALKYQIIINGIDGDAKLLEAIEWTVTVGDDTTALADLKGELLAGKTSDAIVLSGHMKEEAGNEYQDLTVEGISIVVNATQYTYEEDSFGDQYDAGAGLPWTGDSDTEWYDGSATEYVLDTAEDLAGFAELVNSGKTFKGKTVKLAADMDLAGKTWTPVGISSAKAFYGTFDGQGHTISNFELTTSSGKYGAGFFGNLLGGSAVKNVNFDSVSYSIRSNVVGVVAGYLYGSATFENIKVTNVDVRSFGKVGGILGMAADPGAHTITMTNCSVEGVIGGGYNVGGLIGLVLQGQTVNLTNCTTNVEFYMNDGGYGFTYVQTEAGLMWNYNNNPVYAGVAEQYCYYDAAENEFCMGAAVNVNFA